MDTGLKQQRSLLACGPKGMVDSTLGQVASVTIFASTCPFSSGVGGGGAVMEQFFGGALLLRYMRRQGNLLMYLPSIT